MEQYDPSLIGLTTAQDRTGSTANAAAAGTDHGPTATPAGGAGKKSKRKRKSSAPTKSSAGGAGGGSSRKKRRARSPSTSESESESGSAEDHDEDQDGDDHGDQSDSDASESESDSNQRRSRRRKSKSKNKSKSKRRSGTAAGTGTAQAAAGGSSDFLVQQLLQGGGGSGVGGSGGNGAVDPNQMAQAVAMLQAQAHNLPYYNPFNNALGPYLNLGGSGSGQGGSQGSPGPAGQQAGRGNTDVARQIELSTSPLRVENHNLRSRIEALEADRFTLRNDVSILKRAVAQLAEKASVDLSQNAFSTLLGNALDPSLRDAGVGQHQFVSPSNLDRNADIPVLPSDGGVSSSGQKNLASYGGALLGNREAGSSASKIRFTRGESETPSVSAAAAKALSNKGVGSRVKNKPRKPELSRAVRTTIFKLMGVNAGGPSGSILTAASTRADNGDDDARDESVGPTGTPSKFGGGGTNRAFHGYTAGGPQLLPDFAEEPVYDPNSGARLWRWDWNKTLRQSAVNSAFANEIRSTIVQAVEDPTNSSFPDVPPDDWRFLDDAIESAYTNMRRERDSQSDPTKLAKRDRHRLLTKKRGLKEEKLRRRKKALDELKAGTSTSKLVALGVPIPVEPEDGWEGALEIGYMSSEEEGDAEQAGQIEQGWESGVGLVERPLVPPGPGTGSNRVFVVSRPAWRSEAAQGLFRALDASRMADRSNKRVVGDQRDGAPPIGTPQWMVKSGVFVPPLSASKRS